MNAPTRLDISADVDRLTSIAGMSADKALRAALVGWACKVAPSYGDAVRWAEDAYRFINGGAIPVRDVPAFEVEKPEAAPDCKPIRRAKYDTMLSIVPTADLTVAEIAERIGTTPPIARRRLQRLGLPFRADAPPRPTPSQPRPTARLAPPPRRAIVARRCSTCFGAFVPADDHADMCPTCSAGAARSREAQVARAGQ